MSDEQFSPEKYLENLSIQQLNEMQKAALDAFPTNREIILSAPTGSGKTLAFLLMFLKVFPKQFKGTYALIISPTRELALQITHVFQSLKAGLKITTCYGGHKREIEENNLKEAPSILVGTPGRLGDHIRRANIDTRTIQMVVLDEFDKSLELGFTEEMKYLLNSLPSLRYKILLSATPEMKLPEFLKMEQSQILNFSEFMPQRTELYKINVDSENKQIKLFNLLCQIGNRKTIIFVNQKETVNALYQWLRDEGLLATIYHGSMEQQARETSLAKFRNGSNNFLITTDLASRGLDITNVRFVIHYDLPETEQIFIHRNGRTARMEASGDVVLFLKETKDVPEYFGNELKAFPTKNPVSLPPKPVWGTAFISAGKKNKINKTDIAGFLMQRAGLKKEDVGLIEVKDFYSFVAIRRSSMNYLIGLGREQKIKNLKVKIAAAR